MIEKLKDSEREELDMLLPWYANGTLDEPDRARIEAALETDPDLALSLSLIREDREAILAAAASVEMPASMQPRFLAQLDGAPDPAAIVAKGRGAAGEDAGLFAGIGSWLQAALFDASPRRLGLIAAAAALVIAVQVGVITTMIATRPSGGGTFTTATGDPGSVTDGGQAFLVQFSQGARTADLAAFLENEKARLVDGPMPGGFFRIRFDRSDARDKDELSALLRGKPEIFRMVLANS